MPSSVKLYCGQIAPEMFIGVFLYRIEMASQHISEHFMRSRNIYNVTIHRMYSQHNIVFDNLKFIEIYETIDY